MKITKTLAGNLKIERDEDTDVSLDSALYSSGLVVSTANACDMLGGSRTVLTDTEGSPQYIDNQMKPDTAHMDYTGAKPEWSPVDESLVSVKGFPRDTFAALQSQGQVILSNVKGANYG